MVRASPGPRNRTRVDVLCDKGGASQALENPGSGPPEDTLIYVSDGGFRARLSDGLVSALGIVLEVVNSSSEIAELVLIGSYHRSRLPGSRRHPGVAHLDAIGAGHSFGAGRLVHRCAPREPTFARSRQVFHARLCLRATRLPYVARSIQSLARAFLHR